MKAKKLSSRALAALVSFSMLAGAVPSTALAASEISDAAGLSAALTTGGSYVLARDIDTANAGINGVETRGEIDGAGHTIKKTNAMTGDALLFQNTDSDWTIRNVTIDGNKDEVTFSDACMWYMSEGSIVFDGVTLQNFKGSSAVRATVTNAGVDMTFKDTVFKDNENTSGKFGGNPGLNTEWGGGTTHFEGATTVNVYYTAGTLDVSKLSSGANVVITASDDNTYNAAAALECPCADIVKTANASARTVSFTTNGGSEPEPSAAPTQPSGGTEPGADGLLLSYDFDSGIDETKALFNGGMSIAEGEGITGNAARFDGSTGYMQLPNGIIRPEMTVMAWVNQSSVSEWARVFDFGKDSSNAFFLAPAHCRVESQIDGKGDTMDCDGFSSVGTWQHFAVTRTADKVQLYRNGVLIKEQSCNNSIENLVEETNYIGKSHWPDALFKGRMDDIKLYSRVLTANEIKSVYNGVAGELNAKYALSDYKALTLDRYLSKGASLPAEGASASEISWECSESGVINDDMTVNTPARGEADKRVTFIATITNGDSSYTKSFDATLLAEADMTGISDYPMSKVRLTNEYLNNANDKMTDYLLSIDLDRYVAGFRAMAGTETDAEPYGGWESSLIAGHTIGHYLSAISQEYAYSEAGEADADVLARLNAMIDALSEAQIKEDKTETRPVTVYYDEYPADKEGCGEVHRDGDRYYRDEPRELTLHKGYLFAATRPNWFNTTPVYGELQFDAVMDGAASIITEAWVPWYTMHKILAGLIDGYKLTGNEKAFESAKLLGDWVYNRVSAYSDEEKSTLLNIEYGGMNDALYELYKLTGKAEYAEAAHMFDEVNLFESMYNKEDVLANKHANTTIPKLIGALNRYRAYEVNNNLLTDSPDDHDIDFYLTAAENFWEMTVNDHSYITGGNSENEHFRDAHTENAYRNNVNCETCNTYNMLKLSRELYKITGERKYADYYENTYLNAIVSSQNPNTGMTMYFQPMASGYFKVYSDPYENFWCCTGSGMESMTKLNDSIYYNKDKTIIVNQYISSVLTDDANGVTLTQTSDLPNGETARFKLDGGSDIGLALRIPDWAASQPMIKVNGAETGYTQSAGYARISGLKGGDEVEITLPMRIEAYGLADSATAIAFKYGPTVLSAGLGEINLEKNNDDNYTESHGMGVRKPRQTADLNEYIIIDSDYGTRDEWIAAINDNMQKTDGKLEFRLKNTDRGELVFTPHYSKYNEYYGIYWYLTTASDDDEDAVLKSKQTGRDENVTIDSIEPGHDQQENGHGWTSSGNTTFEEGVGSTLNYRSIPEGGYVNYQMMVNKSVKNYVSVTYVGSDAGKKMSIYAGGVKIADVTAGDKDETILYEIPAEVLAAAYTADAGAQTISGKDALHIKFCADCGTDAPKLNGKVKTVTDYGTNAALSSLTFDGAELTPAFSADVTSYTLYAGGADTVTLKAVPADRYGLVYVNGKLINDSIAKTLDVTDEPISITVTAEDHETEKTYTISFTGSEPAPTETASAPTEDADKLISEYDFDNNIDETKALFNGGMSIAEDKGITGDAALFDGSTGYMRLPNGIIRPEMTVMAWVNQSSVSEWARVFDFGKDSSNAFFLAPAHCRVESQIDGKGDTMDCDGFSSIGTWQHFAVTRTADRVQLYRNGVLIKEQSCNNAIENLVEETNYIGKSHWPDALFKGMMDDIKLYGRVCTAEEIKAVYDEFAGELNAKNLEKDYNSLTLGSRLSAGASLPTTGTYESNISWVCSEDGVINADMTVNAPAKGEADRDVTFTATIENNGETMTKTFKTTLLAEPEITGISDYPMTEVEMKNEYLLNADAKMVDYFKELDVDKYVAGFREMAGIAHSEKPYTGWETSLIAGHSLGHYVTGVAQAYAFSKALGAEDKELLDISNRLIDALNETQIKEDGTVVHGHSMKKGYLFAAASNTDDGYGEQQFDSVEGKTSTGNWVPWYTMHKILAGLVDTYKQTGNEKALETASALGDWVYNRVKDYDSAMQSRVLGIEYGGMNDILYELYKFTGKTEHAKAAHMFDEISLFDEMYNKRDVLANRHANTTIPKIIGALNRYRTERDTELTAEMLGDSHDAEYYLTVAENFWDMVVNDHSYITGGNSQDEHFRAPHTENAYRDDVNCETCNTYNMLKLSRELYKITGDKKYEDYYENTFLNAIVSSQNPETGMTMYFQPMGTGYFKVYSNKFDNFWCCTGSGMENMSKLNDSIYYKKDNTIIVNQYISSVLTDKDNGVILKQESELPNGETARFAVTSIGAAEDKTENGWTLSAIKAEGSAAVTGALGNGGSEAKTASVYVAGYRGGILVSLEKRELAVNPGESVDYAANAAADADEVRVFAWDGMEPLVSGVTAGAEEPQSEPAEVSLALRIPDWAASEPTIRVNNEEISYTRSAGYTVIDGLTDGDTVEITMPMEMVAYGLADSDTAVAFKYGPTVLSAKLGEISEDEPVGWHGAGIRVPLQLEGMNEYITVDSSYGTRADWMNNLAENMVKTPGKLEFTMKNTDQALVFTPHYSKYNERYGIYWYLTAMSEDEILAAKEKGRESNIVIDSIDPSHDQQFKGHGWSFEGSVTYSETAVPNYCLIPDGGYVDYQMAVDKTRKNYLEVTYTNEGAEKNMTIYAGGEKLSDVAAGTEDKTVRYEIPASIVGGAYTAESDAATIAGKDAIHITFRADRGTDAPKLCDKVRIVTDYSANAALSSLVFDEGTLSPAFAADTIDYTLGGVTSDTVTFRAEPADKYGLVYVNGTLINDASKKTVSTAGPMVITVKAEDHKTEREYTIMFD